MEPQNKGKGSNAPQHSPRTPTALPATASLAIAATMTATSSSTPILRRSPPIADYGTNQRRPSITRAQTSTGLTDATVQATSSRPLLPRATTANQAVHPTFQRTASQSNPRQSLLKRISSHIDITLELTTESSYAHRNRPAPPSHWTDHAHRKPLLRIWDAIHEAAAHSKSKYPRSILGQLVAVENELLLKYPELGEGEVLLGREWMEYVLGVSLRHPFCAQGKMGRWEVLSGAAKAGGMNWGPW